MNFWQQLKKPFFILAPMDDVTDVVFRQIVAEAAPPDVFFTEFTNVDGLFSIGRDKLLPRFKFTTEQHPIVAQIWGKNPENYLKAARLIKKLGFDGIDINMGCPDKAICKNGCCASLIDNHDLAQKIISATRKGAGGLPVSVKTRLGFKTLQTEEWLSFLLQQDLAAITIHGRTAKEMSKVPVHWDEIAKAVSLRDQIAPQTLIIGNGDILSKEEGIAKAQKYHLDGIMIGRGIFQNLWIFAKDSGFAQLTRMTPDKRVKLLLHHATLFDQTWGSTKNFAILRKFFKNYVSDFPNASDIRSELMTTTSLPEVEAITKKYYSSGAILD